MKNNFNKFFVFVGEMSNNQLAHGHYFNKGVILKFLFTILKEHANVRGT